MSVLRLLNKQAQSNKNGSFIYLQEPFFQFWQYLRILILMQRYE
jgi:hypothetical protein